MNDIVNKAPAFNPQDFQKKIKDHVISTFGTLLSEEQFDALITDAMQEFFNAPNEVFVVEKEFLRPGYARGSTTRRNVLQTPISPFKQLVWNELSVLVKERLAAYMDNDNQTHPIKKLLDELFTIPSFEKHEVLSAQELMLKMSAQMMSQYLSAQGMNVKSEIAAAFHKAGMPDLSNKVWS